MFINIIFFHYYYIIISNWWAASTRYEVYYTQLQLLHKESPIRSTVISLVKSTILTAQTVDVSHDEIIGGLNKNLYLK